VALESMDGLARRMVANSQLARRGSPRNGLRVLFMLLALGALASSSATGAILTLEAHTAVHWLDP